MSNTHPNQMQYLIPKTLSDVQIAICQAPINGETYDMIRRRFPNFCNRRIAKFIKRACLGYQWDITNVTGRVPYSGSYDESLLYDIISEFEFDLNPLSVRSLISKAFEIKLFRHSEAMKFLLFAKCDTILEQLKSKYPFPPSRSWVTNSAERNQIYLKNPREIDRIRLLSSTVSKIQNFFDQWETFIKSFPKPLIFAADETMLNLNKVLNVASTKAIGTTISVEEDPIPHVSAMLCHNPCGTKLPPFLISPIIRKVPADPEQIAQSQNAWIASSESGWQNRSTFLLWTIHFVHFINAYRSALEIKNHSNLSALLLLDGHTSRENSAALKIFALF